MINKYCTKELIYDGVDGVNLIIGLSVATGRLLQNPTQRFRN